MTASPQEVADAAQELTDCAVPGIDLRIIAEVLDAHPHLVHAAREWGWHDTEVRDGLFVYLWSHLTGGHPEARMGESEREQQIYEGQRQWLADRRPDADPL